MNESAIVPHARLGVIIPSSNRVAEPNFQRFSPPGVVPHFMRLRMSGKHRSGFDALIPRVEEAAAILSDAKCNVVLLQCTGTSMSGGYGGEREIVAAIERAAGVPGLTTANCLMAAFERLGVRRLVFISENDPAGYAEKREFLTAGGYEVLAGEGADLRSDQSCVTPPSFWRELALAHRRAEADAYFISCANINAIDTIETLEADLGRPVLTSNQVALWHAVRTAGVDDALPGLGRLGRLGNEATVSA